VESQKAILALDGGGLRGAFTLGFLGELESLIAHQRERVRISFWPITSTSSAGPPRARSLLLVCRWVGALRD